MRAPGVFVTGTGTGVGKTVLGAAVAAALCEAGLDARALKPVMSGLADPPDARWPHDHVLLGRACGRRPEDVSGFVFDPPVSPHLAAQMARRPLRLEEIVAWVEAAAEGAQAAVVEGVGGLLVPLGDGLDVAALAGELALPLLVVGAPGLGTINHTLLTVEAARNRGLEVLAVVLSPWPEAPDEIQLSNRETIARLTGIEVLTFPHLSEPTLPRLASAGRGLAPERWLRTRVD